MLEIHVGTNKRQESLNEAHTRPEEEEEDGGA